MLFNHEQELNKAQADGEMELALAKAAQERVDALAEQEAELEKQGLLELTRAEQELREHAEGALAAAEQERVDDRPPIVVPPTVLVQRPPEAWGEGR